VKLGKVQAAAVRSEFKRSEEWRHMVALAQKEARFAFPMPIAAPKRK